MKIAIKELENKIGYKIKRNFKSVGLDTATSLGICFLHSDEEYLSIDPLIISFRTKDMKEKYNTVVKTLDKIIDDDYYVIAEDVFHGINPTVTIVLGSYRGMVISCAVRKNLEYETISAVSARSKFKIKTAGHGKGNAKMGVKEWIDSLGVDIKSHDAADGFVLALLGMCEGMDFRSQSAIKKATKKKATKKKRATKKKAFKKRSRKG